MFSTSPAKSIDSQLNDLVEKIENDNPTLSVLAARQFSDRLYQTPVTIKVTKPRTFNVLEEFILRASIEFVPPPTEAELAQILKLDPVFVENTIETLQWLQTLESTAPDSPIQITARGRDFYEGGSVPQPPESKLIYAISDRLSGDISWRSSSLVKKKVSFPDLAELVSIENPASDVASLTTEEIQKQLSETNLGLHVPEQGQIVSDFEIEGDSEAIASEVSLFAIFDRVEERLILQLRKDKQILEFATETLQAMEAKEEVSVTNLFNLSEEEYISLETNEIIETRQEKIRRKEVEECQKEKGGDKSEFVLLRDRQIRPEFLSAIKAADKQILIYSPWATEEVIDAEFIKLLQKVAKSGVWILFGYGIARTEEEETKPISPKLKEKLLQVKTPEDLPAAQILWLGNSHAKEVLVDRKLHLSGSHNWLSYRGDRLPRGENSYKVTNGEIVGEAYEYLAGRFQSRLEELWDEAVASLDADLGLKSICIWCALGMEEKALQELQYHNWLALLPVWLKATCQGLRSKQISADAAIFASGISWCSKVSETEEYIELLREGWRTVMEAIARQNREVALGLLNEEGWATFQRLAIPPASADTPEKFISELVGEVKKTKRKKTASRKGKAKK
ncbi:MAG: hypothetical protein SXA11_11975 [Cyanobacteriota bacterium]|nr:hypothetical protein [Cyanobacteriota bacterium]